MNRIMIAIISLIFVIASGCTSDIPSIGHTSEHDAGYTISKVQIQSDSLGKKMNMNIFLPQGYSVNKAYPVLYLLHGSGGNEDSWIKDMDVDQKAAKLIEDDQLTPLIIVMPNYDNSYGVNYSMQSYSGNGHDYGRYEDFLYKDIVNYVDTHYSTMSSREGRYIGGLSMGGFAALEIAFKHQDQYSKVGGHSPAMFLDATSDLKWLFDSEAMRDVTDPIRIANEVDINQLEIYLDHGDRDMGHVIDSTQLLHRMLEEKDANVQYHTSRGEHNRSYWLGNTDDYLKFYAGN